MEAAVLVCFYSYPRTLAQFLEPVRYKRLAKKTSTEIQLADQSTILVCGILYVECSG